MIDEGAINEVKRFRKLNIKKDNTANKIIGMNALDINWTAKTILGGIYIQQKSFWDPDGIFDNISLIHRDLIFSVA